MVNSICWRRGNRIGEELYPSIRRSFRKFLFKHPHFSFSFFFRYTFTCPHKAREDVTELSLKFVDA